MKFTCHPVSESHPYSSSVAAWMIVGAQGPCYYAGFLSTAKDKALAEHPEATFQESFGVLSDEVHILQHGVRAYAWWVKNDRPVELDPSKPWDS